MPQVELTPENIAALVAAVIAVASAVTAMFPTQFKSNPLAPSRLTTAINSALRVLNLLALNVGRNRNADDPK